MAVEISDGGTTPHATDYSDLLAKLKTFATANGWTSLEDSADKLVLQGSGSGSDEIFVAFQKYADVAGDAYGWRLNGYTGYQSGYTFYLQPGAITTGEVQGYGSVAIPLWNGTIPYWFIVSARRIMVVAKISTTYQMCYAGFYLPYASPGQYPYPLAIGGSFIGNGSQLSPRWSGTSGQSSHFWTWLANPTSSMLIRMPGGYWYGDYNKGTLTPPAGMYPFNQSDCGLMRQAVDDALVLTPAEIHQASSSPSVYSNKLGELDGVYHVAGFGVSAEDVSTFGGNDYLVVPNVFRSGVTDYAAVKLA